MSMKIPMSQTILVSDKFEMWRTYYLIIHLDMTMKKFSKKITK